MEPRKIASGLGGGEFFIRAGDEKKAAAGKPQLSAQWGKYLLPTTMKPDQLKAKPF